MKFLHRAIVGMAAVNFLHTAVGQQPSTMIGIEGGPTYGWMVSSETGQYQDPQIGFRMGGAIQGAFGATFSFRTGLAFERKVAADTYDHWIIGQHYAGKIRYEHDHFQLPLILLAGFGERTRWSIHAGGYFGYLFKRSIWRFPEGGRTSRAEAGSTAAVIGAVAGGGVEFPLGSRGSLSLELRYDHGITNLNRSESTYVLQYPADIPTLRTRTILFSIGLWYHTAKRTGNS